MAIGPAVANLSEEEYDRFIGLERYLNFELHAASRKRFPVMGFGVRIRESITKRMEAAVIESYLVAGWEKVDFKEDPFQIFFHRKSFVP